jgi:3'-5' exoribonuclease
MKQFISDLREGERVNSPFLLKKKELGKTKNDKPYLRLAFADKTGLIEGRLWDMAEVIDTRIKTGQAVVVKGVVDLWRSNTQIKVDDVFPASDDEFEKADLVRCVADIEKIFEDLKNILRRHLSNKWIILLVKSFLEDEALIERLKKAPGARSWHNAYIGGLLEHTYEVMMVIERMFELYPEINKDVALLGAFWHDIGKMDELDAETFEYTNSGGLIGHIAMGYELLHKRMSAIPDFPEDLALHLKHLILAHHGEYEQQSPVLPKTLEAIIVYHADNLVSQANAVREIMFANAANDTDWSNFISIKNRKFFLKRVAD